MARQQLGLNLVASWSLSFMIGAAAIAAEGQPQRPETERPTTGEPPAGKPAEPEGGGATTLGQPPGGAENHVQEATKHAQTAAGSGKKGDFSSIAKHARLAKIHVEAALKDKPDDAHLEAALKSLDEAILKGQRGNGGEARKAAKEAVSHLKAAE